MDRIDEKILQAYDGIVKENTLNEGKLTKKDFDSLASIMKGAKNIDDLKQNLVGWAYQMNPAFNVDKFRKAAGLNEAKASGMRMEKAKELRVMTMDDLIQDTPLTKLKVVAQNKNQGIEKFVKTQGLQWKDSPKMLFGGYWYNPKTKEAYMPT